jgi:hypothetical protein
MRSATLFVMMLAGIVRAEPSDTKVFEHTCQEMRAPAIRAMVESGFHPTLIDKDSGLATFAYPNQISINSQWGQRKGADAIMAQFVMAPSYARGYMGRVIVNLRIDSASLLFNDQGDKCGVTVKLDYALFVRDAGWHAAESNFAFEGRLLDLAYYRLLDATPKKDTDDEAAKKNK